MGKLVIHSTVHLRRTANEEATCDAKPGEEILSPINGIIDNTKDSLVTIKYQEDDCILYFTIKNLKPSISNGQTVESSEKIGVAQGEVKLSVKKEKSFGKEKIDSYLAGNFCPSKKTSTDNKTSSGTNKKETPDDLGIMNPYKVAALPFLGLQKGAKAIMRFVPGLSTESEEEITNIVEEVNRIKQLMK